MDNSNETQIKKLFQEHPIIIFDSLMKGYSQVHQQRPMTIHKFRKDVRILFKLAQELTKKNLENKAINTKNLEIPINKKADILKFQ